MIDFVIRSRWTKLNFVSCSQLGLYERVTGWMWVSGGCLWNEIINKTVKNDIIIIKVCAYLKNVKEKASQNES